MSVVIPETTFAMRESMSTGKTVVTVKAFEIEMTEVTVAAYASCVAEKACVDPSPSATGGISADDEALCNWGKPGRGDHPINCVSPAEAETYCNWNGGGRLPTTHELYWAALGDGRMSEEKRMDPNTHRYYPWGRLEPEKIDHCWKRSAVSVPKGGVIGPMKKGPAPVVSDIGTCAVGSYAEDASAYGVYDLAGNVQEMIFDPRPKKCISLAGEQPCPKEKMYAVAGGGWSDNETIGNANPGDSSGLSRERSPHYGFRCVKTQTPK